MRYEVNTPRASQGMCMGKGSRGVRYEAGRCYTYSMEREVNKVCVGKLGAGDGSMIDKMGACAEA